ncbi:MAG: hypothetical protein H6Q54_2023, partial [Deltaproteobacteria bacterium]|nr:hypothetical protein [Deltaproteobacteria bacterium]
MEARKGKGIEELMAALKLHRTYLENDTQGKSKKKENIKSLVLALFKEEFWGLTLKRIQGETAFEEVLQKAQDGLIDPYKAVQMGINLALTKG